VASEARRQRGVQPQALHGPRGTAKNQRANAQAPPLGFHRRRNIAIVAACEASSSGFSHLARCSRLKYRVAQPFGQADALRAAPSARGLPQTLGLTRVNLQPVAVVLRTLMLALAAAIAMSPPAAAQTAKEQVFAAERAFAKSMADRDLQSFKTFLSEEAIFFTGSVPLRGKEQVAEGWARFFTAPVAPFSWEPDEVEVLQSGKLALSTGLVRDPAGKVIARFNSIWRLEAPNVWRVVFDKGSPPGPEER
jgi:ketosteroid isomerase-like protein